MQKNLQEANCLHVTNGLVGCPQFLACVCWKTRSHVVQEGFKLLVSLMPCPHLGDYKCVVQHTQLIEQRRLNSVHAKPELYLRVHSPAHVQLTSMPHPPFSKMIPELTTRWFLRTYPGCYWVHRPFFIFFCSSKHY